MQAKQDRKQHVRLQACVNLGIFKRRVTNKSISQTDIVTACPVRYSKQPLKQAAVNLWMLHFQLFDFRLVHAALLSTPTQQVKACTKISQRK